MVVAITEDFIARLEVDVVTYTYNIPDVRKILVSLGQQVFDRPEF